MVDIISELSAKFETELQNIKNSEELENIRVSYLGKKGSVTAAMKEMGKLSAEEKKEFGQKINLLKNTVADRISAKKDEIAALELQKEIDRVPEFDIDYGRHQGKLTLHVHYYTDGNRGKEPKVLSKDDELYKRFHRVFRGVRI